MSRIVDISVPAERVSLGNDGRGQMVFSVTNRTTAVQRVSADFAPSGATRKEWLSLTGEPQRELSAGGTDQFIVNAQLPPGTPAGTYPFRLRVSSANNRTSEEYEESPMVQFEMPAVGSVKKKPWWILAAAAAVLIVVAVTAFLLTRDRGPRVPDVVKQDAVEAVRAVQAAGLAAELEFAIDASVERGHIIKSAPAAGTTVSEGEKVLLTVSRETPGTFPLDGGDATQLSDATAQQLTDFVKADGAPPPRPAEVTVQVPSVIKMEVVAAMLALQGKGLLPKLQPYDSAVETPNVVLSQVPQAGKPVAPNTEVTLVIAQRPNIFIPIYVKPIQQQQLEPTLLREVARINDHRRRAKP
jgi:hypothetical protein